MFCLLAVIEQTQFLTPFVFVRRARGSSFISSLGFEVKPNCNCIVYGYLSNQELQKANH